MIRGVLIQSIVRVAQNLTNFIFNINYAYQEEILQTIDDGVDREHRLPILSQDIEAHVTVQINVGMINGGLALHLGWLVWIIGSDFETEHEPTTSVKSLKVNQPLEAPSIAKQEPTLIINSM